MSTRRIIINTVATYIRSVTAAALALFSSRWVLSALGSSDYGLFSVVGSIIAIMLLLNYVLSASAARHFAYGIGKDDVEAVNQWFNSAFSIHLILPIVLIPLGWAIGEYCIAHILVIPSNRIFTCLWVFRISLVAAFFSMITTPFIAMFTAKQHLTETAIWDTLQSLLTFLLAFILTCITGDRLLFYAVGMVVIVACLQIGQSLRAMMIFRECQVRYSQWLDAERCKQILSFALWSLFGNSGGLLRNQGITILLNLYFGPKVNAAYGISNVVSAQTGTLANAMLGSFAPEIIASEGRGDRTRMLDLAMRACKFGVLLVMLFAIPLIVEMDYVLKLWLHEPPQYAALFCQLMLVVFLIDLLTVGYMLAVSAHGRIAAYQVTLGTLSHMNLLLAWLFLKHGYAPTSVVFALIIVSVILAVGRVLWGRHLLNMSVRGWITGVFIPCAAVAAVSTLAAMSSAWLLTPSITRLILVIASSITATILAGWFLALGFGERDVIRRNIRRSWMWSFH